MKLLRRVSVLRSFSRAVGDMALNARNRHKLSQEALRRSSPFAYTWRNMARESVKYGREYQKTLVRYLRGILLDTMHGKAVWL